MSTPQAQGASKPAPAAVRVAPVAPKVEELVDASRNQDETAVSTILALGGVDVNGKSSIGSTPLIAAAESGNVQIVRLLLQHGADPDRIVVATGSSPLRAAISGGDGECILELINSGANVNLETPRGTALTTAAALGDVSTIMLLAERGVDIDFELRDGLTALMVAVREDQREAVKALLQCGADPEYKSRDGQRTAGDLALDKGLPEVYSLLMQRSIVQAADHVLEDVERRQQEACKEREQETARARQELQHTSAAARAESSAKISSLKAESDELLARLGISRPQRGSGK